MFSLVEGANSLFTLNNWNPFNSWRLSLLECDCFDLNSFQPFNTVKCNNKTQLDSFQPLQGSSSVKHYLAELPSTYNQVVCNNTDFPKEQMAQTRINIEKLVTHQPSTRRIIIYAIIVNSMNPVIYWCIKWNS